MPTQAIGQPFPYYAAADGEELNGGYVYIGTAGSDPRSSPVTVYWDAALSIPATQPLRTSNGVIVRGGSPARVFYPYDYSIMVLDSRLATVFSSLSGNNPLAGSIRVTAETAVSLVASDIGNIVETTSDDAVTVTISAALDAAAPIGKNSVVDITQIGEGLVTIAGDGFTPKGVLTCRGQYSGLTVYKRASQDWVVIGGA